MTFHWPMTNECTTSGTATKLQPRRCSTGCIHSLAVGQWKARDLSLWKVNRHGNQWQSTIWRGLHEKLAHQPRKRGACSKLSYVLLCQKEHNLIDSHFGHMLNIEKNHSFNKHSFKWLSDRITNAIGCMHAYKYLLFSLLGLLWDCFTIILY